MDLNQKEVLHDVPPYVRVYKDGTIDRLVGYEVAPAGLDPQTGVESKDVVISPETGLSVRLYRPTLASTADQKLPLVIYFHGGAFCVATAAEPKYHGSLNRLVAGSRAVAVSVDYRLAPEHPLPAAFDDSWAALQWVASHLPVSGDCNGYSVGAGETWLKESVDFDRVYLAGDSAGSTIAHHLAIRNGTSGKETGLKIAGAVMIHPYFWGKEPMGSEKTDPIRKAMVDKWWEFVCPSDKGFDDPLINPFASGAPDLAGLGCRRVLVVVAQKDILRDRGRLYYESLGSSEWGGKAEWMEVEGEDHVFHIFDPDGGKAVNMIERLATFIQG